MGKYGVGKTCLANSTPFFSSEAPLFLLVSTVTKPVQREWGKAGKMGGSREKNRGIPQISVL